MTVDPMVGVCRRKLRLVMAGMAAAGSVGFLTSEEGGGSSMKFC